MQLSDPPAGDAPLRAQASPLCGRCAGRCALIASGYAPRMDRAQSVRETWQTWSSGDLDAIEAAFASDRRWRAVEDGPWNCENGAQILDVIHLRSDVEIPGLLWDPSVNG